MKNLNHKKNFLLLVSIVLLLTFAVSSTVAYLIDATDSVTNTFTPSSADVSITDEVTSGTKNNVVITNTGSVKAYIRAKVVASWMIGDKIVAPWKESESGTISYNSPWFKGSDGFYYYPNPVNAETAVPTNLFTSYTPTHPDSVDSEAKLVMDIIVQAIQAEPHDAVEDAWGVTVNGTTISN